MALITWNDNLKTNVAECDQQHQRLIELINSLHDAMKAGKGREILEKVLSSLAEYTVYHSQTEEALFQQHGYPKAAEHKKQHNDLTRKVKELTDKLSKGQCTITLETLDFLTDWLKNHIQRSDKEYGPFLAPKTA